MIYYWPHEPSIELQQSVAQLLSKTKQKLKNNLCNKTYFHLYTDILDDFHKEKILRIITKELENLVLDLIEMNISIKEINLNQTKILFYLVNKSLNKISQETYIKINSEFHNINIFSKNLTHDNILLYYLLIYFLFGSSYIESHIFGFNPKETPQEHVKILCENLIIQISNLIMYQLLYQIENISEITFFIHKNFLCNNTYISNRSIALFLNTLLIQNFIHFYINQTRIIYNNRYCVFLLSTKGIIKKYIYIHRLNKLTKLHTIQYIFLCIIELLDILIPKIEKLFLMLIKFFIYVLINIVSNIIIIIIKIITIYLNA